MLNSMREGSGARIIKYVALGFVLLGVGGMVFMDVGGFFRGGMTDTTLARVGRTKIDVRTFERTATPAIRAQNMTMQEAYRFGLLGNMLDEMIAREIMRQEAAREGLLISRSEIALRVSEMLKSQIQPGETPQQALDRVLRTQGLGEGELVASMRQSMTGALIQTPLRAGLAYVPDLVAEALDRIRAERRDIAFFTLTPEKAGASVRADDATLATYYQSVKDQYQVPEQRTFRALVLSAEDLRKEVKVTDDDVKAAFEERKDQFRRPERRKIEQVIFQDEARAKEALDEMRAGKPLKAAAGAQGGYRDPDEVEKAALPPELAEPVFAATKSALVGPLKTPLGWHVVRVLDITPARALALDEVRADLRRELESDATHSEMESRVNKIDEALSRGDSLDEAAKGLNLPIEQVGPIDLKGGTTDEQKTRPIVAALAQNRDLLSSLFELMEGETGDLTEITDGLYAVFSLDKVTPTRDRDFASVRAQIEKKWLDEQRQKAMNELVDRLMAGLARRELTFEQAAAQSGAVVKTARDVSRESKVAGINDPVALTRLFDETDLNAVVKIPTEKSVVLAKVLDARIPAPGAGKSSLSAKAQWRRQMENAVTALFVSDLRAKGHVRVNDRLLEKLYGGKPENR